MGHVDVRFDLAVLNQLKSKDKIGMRRERAIDNGQQEERKRPRIDSLLVFLVFTFCFSVPAAASRLKDVARIEGFRSNQLFGYGLVVGLNGTGDRQNTEFTVQTLANLLQDYNIRVSPSDVRVKNVAAV